jgi:molecular chaperone IbpA
MTTKQVAAFPYGRSILPSTVGFDRLISTLEELDGIFTNGKPVSYPPYNIVKVDEYKYEIQIAVAGFGIDDITIESNQNKLSVSGISQKPETEVNYLHHGLANRDFRHVFTLSDTSIVRSADIKNGVLMVSIENVIPEEKKPRIIPIGSSSTQKLLIEETV